MCGIGNNTVNSKETTLSPSGERCVKVLHFLINQAQYSSGVEDERENISY